MPDLPKAVKQKRVKDLEQVRARSNAKFLDGQRGKVYTVLTEQSEHSLITGHTPNFIKAYLPEDAPLDSLVKVMLSERYLDGVKGQIIKEEHI